MLLKTLETYRENVYGMLCVQHYAQGECKNTGSWRMEKDKGEEDS